MLDAVVVGPQEAVGVVETARNLDRDVEPLLEARILLTFQPLAEVATVHILDEEPRHAADLLQVVRATDVRMDAESDPRLRLALEARTAVGGGEHRWQRSLHGHQSPQLAVERDGHHRHPAPRYPLHLVAPVHNRTDEPAAPALGDGDGGVGRRGHRLGRLGFGHVRRDRLCGCGSRSVRPQVL